MFDLKEERRYKLLKRLGRELRQPIPEAFLELEVRDKDGKVIYQDRQRSHSWTRNAYNFMFSSLAAKNPVDSTFGAGKLSIKDTGGVVRYGGYPIALRYSISHDVPGYGYLAAATNDGVGIVVGSGTNAESFEDFKLQTLIEDGTLPGQLSYTQSESHVVSYVGTTLKDVQVRFFNNNTGGGVEVNEVALNIRAYVANVYRDWVNSRDHLPSTVTVPDTGQLKVTYTISLTYPE